jgi:tRNA(Arg) A34 adenosine deaminase TadA
MKPAPVAAIIVVRMSEIPEQFVTVSNEAYMRSAIDIARRGLLAGEPPIGACLVRNGEVVVVQNNAVIGDLDVTAHAEIRAIREACHRLRTLKLSDCRLFVTVEPCPMCLSACYYADISEIVFAARLSDINRLTRNELIASDSRSFNELFVDHATNIEISGDCLRDESLSLLEEWAGRLVRAK